MNILDVHFAVPEAGQLVVDLSRLFVLDCSTNGVVSAREVALGLKLDVRNEVILRAPHIAVVAKFVLHFSEKDASGVHVRLRQDAKPY